jgi:hypothetical protein
MNQTKQEKTVETPVVSPLAKDKTYGEKKYDLIFDWGLNYWANLLSSAFFSQWAANSTKAIKIPGLAKSRPRDIQENLGKWVSKQGFMQGYFKSEVFKHGGAEASKKLVDNLITHEQAGALLEKATKVATINLHKRGFAMAESLTLLVPGFAVMLPSVWLGAKIKPKLVQWFDRRHYGDDSMEDPSLKARHQAIAAEERPTLLGTIMARFGTVVAVQLSSKLIGSESNSINWIGEKTNSTALQKFPGINPIAGSIGEGLGNSMPAGLQQKMNNVAGKVGLSWSNEQIKNGKTGVYTQATQDLMKFISMDTIYTLVSAGTIRPFLKLLSHVPGMTYKPKVAENSATFEGEKIKIPGSPFTDTAADTLARDVAAPAAALSNEQPTRTVSNVRDHATLVERSQPQIA